jgi:tellurite resistance protein TerC
VMRLTMIFIGAALINRFHWILYVFGAFLVYTGIRMFRQEDADIQPEENPVVRLVTRYIPITRHYEGEKFFTRVNGKLTGTLLLLVLVIVEVTDLVFAVDSIPAIFAITTNTFIVYTSNVFAILGLRSMYFLLAGVVEKFQYLRMGLAIVLTFIGVKMLIEGFHIVIPVWISLVVVAVVLLSSVAASIIWPKDAEMDIDVEMPQDFDSLFEDDPEEPSNQKDDDPEDSSTRKDGDPEDDSLEK